MKKLLLHILKAIRNVFVTALVIGVMVGFFWLLSLSAPYSYIPFIIPFIAFIMFVYAIVSDELG